MQPLPILGFAQNQPNLEWGLVLTNGFRISRGQTVVFAGFSGIGDGGTLPIHAEVREVITQATPGLMRVGLRSRSGEMKP